jgi:hypothetical protein
MRPRKCTARRGSGAGSWPQSSRGKLAGGAAAGALALVVALAGCSGVKKDIDKLNASQEAYSELQGFIHDQLTTKFHRSVRSVSCSPHVDQVPVSSVASMTCQVIFTDGTSYTTAARVTDPSTDPDVATYTYEFTDPPAIDITTAPLPAPAVTLSAASPHSLLAARNLTRVVRKLTARYGHDLIVQLAIYPGELQAVLAASGGEARLVTVSEAGALTAGAPSGFSGSRSGISFGQLDPAVIQALAGKITASGVPLARLDRFVLTNSLPGSDSGWEIYLTGGNTHYQALVLGQELKKISPAGTARVR